ncbi:phosphoribosyltransferase [Aestuariivita boseongensis]|uniref:phosphoribosyltransferase n=1 Tax=Aestuariivita boseongensis TaxID=1470562 RepID=UPI0006834F69|nr:phosphoribosyltransferase family protein [Aestuariivita boseongensis]
MTTASFRFADRSAAGKELADRLVGMELDRPLVFALPRGGVPVAVEVARALQAPLDVILVRKISAPSSPEVAIAAVVEGATADLVISRDIMRMSGIDMDCLQENYAKQVAELERRKTAYVGDRPRLDPKGRTAVVVDDGIATGATMKAALTALRRNGAGHIVVALPVAPTEILQELKSYADDIICLHPVTYFRAVSMYFGDFHQLTDAETIALLDAHRMANGDAVKV